MSILEIVSIKLAISEIRQRWDPLFDRWDVNCGGFTERTLRVGLISEKNKRNFVVAAAINVQGVELGTNTPSCVRCRP